VEMRCTAPFVGVGVFDLKVLPGGHLFAGTDNGLYVSDDAGVTCLRRRTQVTWSLAAVTARTTDGCVRRRVVRIQ
jgi:hypothetical protein